LDTNACIKITPCQSHPTLDADDDREPTIAEQIDAMTDPSFMTSLARGLAVLRAFSDARNRRPSPASARRPASRAPPCAAACTLLRAGTSMRS
jgi:hypothetical protein